MSESQYIQSLKSALLYDKYRLQQFDRQSPPIFLLPVSS